jgi:hypothetical protein
MYPSDVTIVWRVLAHASACSAFQKATIKDTTIFNMQLLMVAVIVEIPRLGTKKVFAQSTSKPITSTLISKTM